MLENLLTPEAQKFIREHEQDDERQLVLKHREIAGVPSAGIAEQIAGRRKAKDKLPTYYNTPGILYPPAVNLEQSSSEQTAKFKAGLLLAALTEGVDITGGLGIDTYFLSQKFSRFHYVEPNARLLEIARHNHTRLGSGNIQYHTLSAEDFVDQQSAPVDFVFIDPSRRSESGKVFTFSDSEPNIITLQKKIFERSSLLLIKASPLFDIKKGIEELSFVKKVYAVSVDNEVKELLFLCEKGFTHEPLIEAVNLTKQGTSISFGFSFSEENNSPIEFSDPLTHLYEPNASLLKAGAFRLIAKRFNLLKIQASTHLYTSDSLIENFPGRVFKIEAHVKPDAKMLAPFFPEGKANITTRNYPLTVEELKKKTHLTDGGEKFLIGFSGVKAKFLVVAFRLSHTMPNKVHS